MRKFKVLASILVSTGFVFITGCHGSNNSSTLQWDVIDTTRATVTTNNAFPSIAFSNTKINGQQFLYYTSSSLEDSYKASIEKPGAPIVRYNISGNNISKGALLGFVPLMSLLNSSDHLYYAPLHPQLQITNGNLYATALYNGNQDDTANTFIFYCGAIGLLDAECVASDILVSKVPNSGHSLTSNNFLADPSNGSLYLVQGVGQVGGIVYGVDTSNELKPKFTTSELAIIPPEDGHINYIRSSVIDNQHHLWISTLRSDVNANQQVKIYEFQLNGIESASLLAMYNLDLSNVAVDSNLLSQSITVGNNNSIYITLLASGNPYTFVKNVNNNKFTLLYSGILQHNDFDQYGEFLQSAWFNNKLYNATMIGSNAIDNYSSSVYVSSYANQGATNLVFNNPIIDANIYNCNYSTLLPTNIGLFFASTCGTPYIYYDSPVPAFTIQLLK